MATNRYINVHTFQTIDSLPEHILQGTVVLRTRLTSDELEDYADMGGSATASDYIRLDVYRGGEWNSSVTTEKARFTLDVARNAMLCAEGYSKVDGEWTKAA